MAVALPYIAAAATTYSAVQAGKSPKLPPVRELADPDSKQKKRKDQREMQKKYGESGRASTLLSGGSSSLG